MAFLLLPAPGRIPSIAGSFGNDTEPELGNPTLLPRNELAKYDFTFLIRHPRLSVAGYYRLTIPSQSAHSKVANVHPDDLGYSELRSLFDFLLKEDLIRLQDTERPPGIATLSSTTGPSVQAEPIEAYIIDAEDLIRNHATVTSTYCSKTGLRYDPAILHWDEKDNQGRAAGIVDRWNFKNHSHHQVLSSKTIEPQRPGKSTKEDDYANWVDEFGVDGAEAIRTLVNGCMLDYEELKQYRMVF